MMKTSPFNLDPAIIPMNNISATSNKLTATDNAILRYNVSLSPEFRKKLKKYFRLFAKSYILTPQLADDHLYKDFLYLNGSAYEVAYRECGRDHLEQTPQLDLLLSVREAYDNNVRICLVTPLTADILQRIENYQAVSWLEPAGVTADYTSNK